MHEFDSHRSYGSEEFKRLKLRQKTLIILTCGVLVSPPLIVMFLNLPPAEWLNAQQSKLFGYYLGKLTLAILIFLYGLVLFVIVSLIALPLKLITGKTIGELIRKNEPATELMNVREENGDEHAELCIERAWLEQGKRVLVVSLDGRYFRLQLSEVMLPGTRLRMAGKARQGGDLYLQIRVQ